MDKGQWVFHLISGISFGMINQLTAGRVRVVTSQKVLLGLSGQQSWAIVASLPAKRNTQVKGHRLFPAADFSAWVVRTPAHRNKLI
jgi:hypothetical protein